MTSKSKRLIVLRIKRKRRASGGSFAATLIVFVLLFLGVGYATTQWLLPTINVAAQSFEADLIWAVLLFIALVLATSYSSKKHMLGAG